MSEETNAKLSKNEAIKTESVYLKGKIAEEIADTSTGEVSKESYELLKFHGTYQQFDRDKAEAAKKEASARGDRASDFKEWIFMVRLKIPAGRLKAEQYLRLDDVAGRYAANTLRITTRETFQFHFIVKGDLKSTIAEINEQMVSTIGACGDIVRNVMATSAPIKDKKHQRIFEDAIKISDFTVPKTSAYHEIWLDGENVARAAKNETYEPLYGRTYLPRKFKIGITHPEDNSIDVLTHDLAILALFDGQELQGYNFFLGGGMGMTHNKKETYPRMATPVAFIGADDLIKGVEAVVKLTRDHGDRSNRKHARLKYLVEEKGAEWTRKTLEEYFGSALEDVRPMPPLKMVDHTGWHAQGDGKWYLGLPIASGRVIDRGDERIRSGIRKVVETYAPDVILTADQNMLLGDLEEKDKPAIEAILRNHGIKLHEEVSPVFRNTLACVSLPTCGLALAEAERVQVPLVGEVEKLLEKHGLVGQELSIRMTGCPNGCARPYTAEIGIVGRMPGHYAMFIGGDFNATRLNTKVFDRVPYEHVPAVIDALFSEYVAGRTPGEYFGSFCHRVGEEALGEKVKAQLSAEHKWAV